MEHKQAYDDWMLSGVHRRLVKCDAITNGELRSIEFAAESNPSLWSVKQTRTLMAIVHKYFGVNVRVLTSPIGSRTEIRRALDDSIVERSA